MKATSRLATALNGSRTNRSGGIWELWLEVATPDEARAILGLKGRAYIGF